MPNATKRLIDDLPRQYNFVMNPYPDHRVSSCPFCGKKTGQRKLPLFIHVDPHYPIALNYTCRYCRSCDLLIAHKHELEHLLTGLFAQANPAVIGNEYLVAGTVDKKAWREGLKQPKPHSEMMAHVSCFKTYYQELRLSRPGWYPQGVEPPPLPPPPATEWVKRQ